MTSFLAEDNPIIKNVATTLLRFLRMQPPFPLFNGETVALAVTFIAKTVIPIRAALELGGSMHHRRAVPCSNDRPFTESEYRPIIAFELRRVSFGGGLALQHKLPSVPASALGVFCSGAPSLRECPSGDDFQLRQLCSHLLNQHFLIVLESAQSLGALLGEDQCFGGDVLGVEWIRC